MRIPIPRSLVRAFDAFSAWGDPTLWRYGRLELRRIDLLLAAAFVICIGYYGYYAGWGGAVKGGVVFVLIATGALLFRR